MNEIKYTTDGKKVIVVGKLNTQETIVQEIFIVNGNEIPSGENFVVKSLHDAPAVSWKETELKKLDERYKKESESIEREINDLRKKYRVVGYVLREKIRFISGACERIDPQVFETLADYICGDIKYIVESRYTPTIIPLDEFKEGYDEKLRLISFFGKDDGSFTYAVGDYSDYSGGSRHFIPCKTYEEALEISKGLFDKMKDYSDTDVISANKLGIWLDPQKLKVYWEKKLEQENASHKREKEQVEIRTKRISDIESELKNIKI